MRVTQRAVAHVGAGGCFPKTHVCTYMHTHKHTPMRTRACMCTSAHSHTHMHTHSGPATGVHPAGRREPGEHSHRQHLCRGQCSGNAPSSPAMGEGGAWPGMSPQ